MRKSFLLLGRQNDEADVAPRQQKEIATQGSHLRVAPRKILEFLVIVVPALWLGSLILRYGVNSPWGDQWDGTFPLFAKMQAGTFSLSDFYAFHNEHRIFFPSLISFFLARLIHRDIRAELLVIWLLACVCAFNVWRIATMTGNRNTPAHVFLLLTVSMLLFTPLQWENLLWGFQIGFFLPSLA